MQPSRPRLASCGARHHLAGTTSCAPLAPRPQLHSLRRFALCRFKSDSGADPSPNDGTATGRKAQAGERVSNEGKSGEALGRGAQPAAGGRNIIDIAVSDHRMINWMYGRYRDPGTHPAERQRLAWAIVRESGMHSCAEEEVMYPAIRKHMGDAVADTLLHEHTDLKQALYEVSSSKLNTSVPSDPVYDAKMARAMQVFNEHLAEEEYRFWPAFERLPSVSQEELVQLGAAFAQAKSHAVTRPHPWAPDQPPFNLVTNRLTAPLDALMDRWRFAFDVPKPHPDDKA